MEWRAPLCFAKVMVNTERNVPRAKPRVFELPDKVFLLTADSAWRVNELDQR